MWLILNTILSSPSPFHPSPPYHHYHQYYCHHNHHRYHHCHSHHHYHHNRLIYKPIIFHLVLTDVIIRRYFKNSCGSTMRLLFLLSIMRIVDVCSGQCRTANWWAAFDRKGWATCGSATEYLTGLYRNDNKGSNDGLYLIEEASCCKAPAPNENQPPTCTNANWWRVLDRSETNFSLSYRSLLNSKRSLNDKITHFSFELFINS